MFCYVLGRVCYALLFCIVCTLLLFGFGLLLLWFLFVFEFVGRLWVGWLGGLVLVGVSYVVGDWLERCLCVGLVSGCGVFGVWFALIVGYCYVCLFACNYFVLVGLVGICECLLFWYVGLWLVLLFVMLMLFCLISWLVLLCVFYLFKVLICTWCFRVLWFTVDLFYVLIIVLCVYCVFVGQFLFIACLGSIFMVVVYCVTGLCIIVWKLFCGVLLFNLFGVFVWVVSVVLSLLVVLLSCFVLLVCLWVCFEVCYLCFNVWLGLRRAVFVSLCDLWPIIVLTDILRFEFDCTCICLYLVVRFVCLLVWFDCWVFMLDFELCYIVFLWLVTYLYLVETWLFYVVLICYLLFINDCWFLLVV